MVAAVGVRSVESALRADTYQGLRLGDGQRSNTRAIGT
jgi:hypothetical protein